MRRFVATVSEVLENEEIDCPIPLRAINDMNRRMTDVDYFEWGMEDDSDIVTFCTIHFKDRPKEKAQDDLIVEYVELERKCNELLNKLKSLGLSEDRRVVWGPPLVPTPWL